MMLSTAGAVREALRNYVEDVMRDLMPKAKIVATPQGDVQALPALGFQWTKTTPLDDRPRLHKALADGRGVWRIFNEEAEFSFTWRTSSFEDAEAISKNMIARIHKGAARKSKEGSRTVALSFALDGLAYEGRLYVHGSAEPYNNERANMRDEWIFKVPALVVYPVIDVDSPSEAAGLVGPIIINIDGRFYTASGGKAVPQETP